MTGLIAVAKTIVPWFLGPDFNDSIVLIMLGAALIMAIGLNNVSGVQYLISVKKQNLFTKSVVIAAVFNFALNFLLIPRLGAIGAIVSSIFAETLIIIIQAVDIRHDFDIKIICQGSLRYILGSVIMFIPVYALGFVLKPTIWTTLIQAITGVTIYGLYLLIIRDKFTRNVIDNVIRKLGGNKLCKLKRQ